MAYNGLEIDILSLGDADSLLLTRWENDVSTYILIDGGYAEDTETVRRFLASRGVDHIDHLVNSHLHDDHAEGLVGLVQDTSLTFGRAWLHLPQRHVDMDAVEGALQKTALLKESRVITASVETERALVAALQQRRVQIVEPFEGKQIDFLTVCSPSPTFYGELLKDFKEVDKIRQLDEERAARDQGDLIEALFGKTASAAGRQLLTSPRTDPVNDSSTVLAGIIQNTKLVLTADAGVKALTNALAYRNLVACDWMQIPHHGSIYNITQALVNKFAPKTAYISAEGKDHPHRAVIRAFKAVGTSAYSTHHPEQGHLRFHVGDVPGRRDYALATPL